MKELAILRKTALAACVLGLVALAACKQIATGEDDATLLRRYLISEVVVAPIEESHRIQLQRTSALEDEIVGISVVESDQQYLNRLDVTTVENNLKIGVSRKTGSAIHQFVMPNGDVRIEASFTWKPSDNAKLAALNPSEGTLVPDFSPDVTDYVMEFNPSPAVSVTFNPIPEHPGASFAASVANGKTTVPVSPGVTVYTVVVTAQDTAAPQETYTITLKKYPNASLSSLEVASPAETSELNVWTSGLDAPASPYYAKLPWTSSAPGDAVLTVATVSDNTVITASGAISDLSSKTAPVSLGYGVEKRVVIDTSCTVEGLTRTNQYEVVLSRYDGQIPVLHASGGDVIRVLWNAAEGRWEETHIFHTNGSLSFNQTPALDGLIFVVGGGGCGGSNNRGDDTYWSKGSGGSAGAVKSQAFSFTGLSYPVVVGAGGGPTAYYGGSSPAGALSSFDTISANGGGGRGMCQGTPGGNGGGSNFSSNITGFADVYAKAGLSGGRVIGRPHTGDGGGGANGPNDGQAKKGWAGGSGIVVARFPL
jgi:hypothetical protein